MSDRVRAFFALPVPDGARAVLAEAQRTLKRRAGDAPRWIDPAQMHLTLKFLGWVDPGALPDLEALTAAAAARAAPIDARWSGVTAFPASRRARVVVAELAEPAGALAALADRLESAVEALGVAREGRAFRAHVTLARIKHPCSVESWIDAARLGGAVRFDELVLYRSELLSTGSVYTALARVRLGAALA